MSLEGNGWSLQADVYSFKMKNYLFIYLGYLSSDPKAVKINNFFLKAVSTEKYFLILNPVVEFSILGKMKEKRRHNCFSTILPRSHQITLNIFYWI